MTMTMMTVMMTMTILLLLTMMATQTSPSCLPSPLYSCPNHIAPAVDGPCTTPHTNNQNQYCTDRKWGRKEKEGWQDRDKEMGRERETERGPTKTQYSALHDARSPNHVVQSPLTHTPPLPLLVPFSPSSLCSSRTKGEGNPDKGKLYNTRRKTNTTDD